MITGGANTTSYTITATNADTCTATSASFTYDGDAQLASPTVPMVSVVAESCSAAASNTVTNFAAGITYRFNTREIVQLVQVE